MVRKGKLISAKRKFNPFTKFASFGNGFPDFIAFKHIIIQGLIKDNANLEKVMNTSYLAHQIIGIEVKSNGYLDKEEREKCRWLLHDGQRVHRK